MSSAAAPRFEPGFGWLLAGVASWFGAWGMQQVLIPWLAVNVLHATAQQTSFVQIAMMLPTMLLLFFGGAVADRVDARWLLAALHLVSVAPPLGIAFAFAHGALSLELLIAAAIVSGVVNSFSTPSRDSLLSRVAGANLTHGVAGLIAVQFAAQGFGMWLARFGADLTAPVALSVQAAFVAIGAITCARLPARPANAAAREPLRFSELAAGLRFVWNSELRAVWPMVAGVGLFFHGAYNVLLPIAVRDVYGGDVREISSWMLAFNAGTILVAGLLFVRGMRRRGRALALALATGGLTLIVAGLGIPFWAALASTFVWGLAGGVFMTAGRALFQERAPAAERSRILAVHQLALVASGPIGGLLSGALGDALGPLHGMLVLGVLMIALIGAVLSASRVWRME